MLASDPTGVKPIAEYSDDTGANLNGAQIDHTPPEVNPVILGKRAARKIQDNLWSWRTGVPGHSISA